MHVGNASSSNCGNGAGPSRSASPMSQIAMLAADPARITPASSAKPAQCAPRVAASKAEATVSRSAGCECCTAARTVAHPASGVTGASVPKARGTPARLRLPKGFISVRPALTEPLLIKLTGLTPGGIERRLHTGNHTQLGQGRDIWLRDHFHVLEAMSCRANARHAEIFGGPAQPSDGRCHGVVTDAMEAGLQSGLGARDHMIGDLPFGQIAGTAGLRIGVRHTQRCRTRADRAVDAKITGKPGHPSPLRPFEGGFGGELAPIRSDTHTELCCDLANPAQILDRSEMRAAQFVNGGDTLCHSCPQRCSRSRPALLIGEEPIQTAAAQMVRLACQQPIRAVTDCLGHTRKLIKKG